jgi:uncharacterized membrane protein AbrB (regulator of aidB expression)
MEEMDAAINATTSDATKIWMNWMMIILLSSLIFVYRHVSARYIFGSLVLMMPIAMMIFNITKSPHLIGVAHIILWIPLVIYLVKTEFIGKLDKLKTPYGIYLVFLLATIIISLYFDIRDAILIALDMKDPFT